MLFPFLVIMVMTRFTLASRASHARIKLLEANSESTGERLKNLLAKIEKDMEDAVEDVGEAFFPGPGSTGEDSERQSTEPLWSLGLHRKLKKDKSQPVLTPAQCIMITNLNTLPNLSKHIVFIHPIRNSHGTIICRNIKTISEHRRGEGVLRHWADGMEL